MRYKIEGEFKVRKHYVGDGICSVWLSCGEVFLLNRDEDSFFQITDLGDLYLVKDEDNDSYHCISKDLKIESKRYETPGEAMSNFSTNNRETWQKSFINFALRSNDEMNVSLEEFSKKTKGYSALVKHIDGNYYLY